MVAPRPDTTTLSRYGYDPRVRKYRDRQTGRYVSASTVRDAIDTLLDAQTVKARNLASQLKSGQVSLADWQAQMTVLLKTTHVAVGLAANGGLKNTSAADLGALAIHIKQQYKFLRTFVQDIKTGKQVMDGTLAVRASLYVQAGRGVYSLMVERAARIGGMQQEKNILGIADHCTGANSCIEQSQKGWVPIGTLVPIGQRRCSGNCRCRMEYK